MRSEGRAFHRPLRCRSCERIEPIEAVNLVKALQQYRLLFAEDPLSPEQMGYFKMIREQCSTPIAMGELFSHPMEWTGLISDRLIDFIRVGFNHIGGITPGLKLARLAEAFGVRTAWHGPGNIDPINHAMPEAYALNNYVLNGVGDPKHLLFGLGDWTWYTQEVLDMVMWMREFNQSGKGHIEFWGFDMRKPGVALANVSKFLDAADATRHLLTPGERDRGRVRVVHLAGNGTAWFDSLQIEIAGKRP